MTIEQFKELESSDNDFLLVDIREEEEVDATSLYPNAQNIPTRKMFAEAEKGNLPKDKKIIVYCASGARAKVVAKKLQSLGFDIDSLDSSYSQIIETSR
jgi:rhodanese-related sulfurtransferase